MTTPYGATTPSARTWLVERLAYTAAVIVEQTPVHHQLYGAVDLQVQTVEAALERDCEADE